MDKLSAGLLAALAYAFISCVPPDARVATVEVDAELRPSVEFAIYFWTRAGASLDWQIGRCGDPVDAGQEWPLCVSVHEGDPGEDDLGVCEYTSALGREIIVAPGMAPNVLDEVMVHEVGHALRLRHVDDDKLDVMRPRGLGRYCVGPGTRGQWAARYGGEELHEICVDLGAP